MSDEKEFGEILCQETGEWEGSVVKIARHIIICVFAYVLKRWLRSTRRALSEPNYK